MEANLSGPWTTELRPERIYDGDTKEARRVGRESLFLTVTEARKIARRFLGPLGHPAVAWRLKDM